MSEKCNVAEPILEERYKRDYENDFYIIVGKFLFIKKELEELHPDVKRAFKHLVMDL